MVTITDHHERASGRLGPTQPAAGPLSCKTGAGAARWAAKLISFFSSGLVSSLPPLFTLCPHFISVSIQWDRAPFPGKRETVKLNVSVTRPDTPLSQGWRWRLPALPLSALPLRSRRNLTEHVSPPNLVASVEVR